MITKADAIASLRPNSQWTLCEENFEWLGKPEDKPTENEIQDEITRLTLLEPFNKCKAQAKRLIAFSDWAALPDVGLANQVQFIAYRAALRALIITPVADPVWPTEPTPIWE
jgi:hypothetical protein